MIYIIKGEETHLIREKLKELSSNEEATVVKLDGAMPDFTVGKMLNACRQIDLFHSFSIVLVKDAPFLISKYDKKDIDDLKSGIATLNTTVSGLQEAIASTDGKTDGKIDIDSVI